MTIEKTVINEKWWVPEEVWLGEQAANDTLRARVAELEGRDRRIRDAAFHPRFNSLESLATIRTILNLAP